MSEGQTVGPKVTPSVCAQCGSRLSSSDGADEICINCLLRSAVADDDADLDKSQWRSDQSTPGDNGTPIDFGDYELLDEIGRGSQGVVYRARQKSLNRIVALKVIALGHWATEPHVKRFRREAEAAARLNHPGIVPIYEVGERDGACYFSMGLVEGGQLDAIIECASRTDSSRGEREPMAIRSAVELIVKLARTVQYAHEHNILHRDIKPGNILLDEKGEPHLTDFGLARLVETESTVTRTREVLGTPSYMAPEQAAGETTKLGKATDVYGLGAVLYQLLTGHPPFAGGTTYETIRLLLNTEPRKPRALNHKIDRDLSTICLKCLEKDPQRRYTSALALAEDLEHWLKHEPVRAKRSGVFTHTRKWVRRNPSMTVLVTLLIALAVGLTLTVWNRKLPVLIPKSVAVLPFENLSEDPNNAYFAEGMQEEILTRLASVADLKVISRTSTQRYHSKPANLAEIAKQLGVANIVEGSVQKAADQVRVSVQLINAQTDSHLWAESYDRKLTDVLGVESEIAKRIAESLQAKLSGRQEQALAAKPTNNPEAYDTYLRGLAFDTRSAWSNPSSSPDLLGKAASFFERAVRLDPNFAIAWARLSRAEANHYFASFDSNSAARDDAAKHALEQAQKLQPDSPETLLALGYYQYRVLRDYGSAKTTFIRVSQMLPNNSEVPLALGRVLRRVGQWDQSIAYSEQALALDPRNVELLMQAAGAYGNLRQFPATLKLYDRVLDITPNDPDVLALKAAVYQAEGNLHEAAKLLENVNAQTNSDLVFETKITQLRLERNYREATRLLQARLAQFHFDSQYLKCSAQVNLAFIQRLAGDAADAKVTGEQTLNTFEKLYSDRPDSEFFAALLSQAYATMGEKDSALKAAEQAMALLPSAKDRQWGPAFEENLALVQTVFGENSRAIEILTRLLQTSSDSLIYPGPGPITPALLRLDPLWDPLRADPAFQKPCEEKIDKSIAVLPFEHLSGDPNNAYFAEGIREEILTRLAKIADLKVISRTSTERYQTKPDDLGEIAKQLGVANILEGSIQRVAAQVRVHVQLINAQTDSQLWAESYDRKLDDVLGVESEIAKRIAESLQATLTGQEEQALAVKPTNNPEAYDAYLHGLVFEARGYSGGLPAISVEVAGFYERAVQLDPNFALAWARLSRVDAGIHFDHGDAARREAAERALDNAQKLAPDSPETLLALGWYQFSVLREYGLAEATFGRVSKMLPGSSEAAMALGRVTRRAGNWDQSIAYLEQALALDPRNVESLVHAAETYIMLRQFSAALKLYDRALDIMPNDPDVMAAKAVIYQAQGNLQEATRLLTQITAQARNGDTFLIKIAQLRLERNYAEAIRLLQARLAQSYFDSPLDKAHDQVALALTQRLAGDMAGAKATAELARNTFAQLCSDQPDNSLFPASLSEAYAAMGEKESALNAAERAIMLLPSAKDAVSGPDLEENLALIQTIFGENSRAISTLNKLLQTPYSPWICDVLPPVTPALLRLDPFWDPLRSDPAFQKLCEEKIDRSIAVQKAATQ